MALPYEAKKACLFSVDLTEPSRLLPQELAPLPMFCEVFAEHRQGSMISESHEYRGDRTLIDLIFSELPPIRMRTIFIDHASKSCKNYMINMLLSFYQNCIALKKKQLYQTLQQADNKIPLLFTNFDFLQNSLTFPKLFSHDVSLIVATLKPVKGCIPFTQSSFRFY